MPNLADKHPFVALGVDFLCLQNKPHKENKWFLRVFIESM